MNGHLTRKLVILPYIYKKFIFIKFSSLFIGIDVTDLPEGVDPSFLAALPEEMRQEVIDEQRRLQTIRQVNLPPFFWISDYLFSLDWKNGVDF